MNGPEYVLADEPTGNLDSKTGNAVMYLFCRLHAKGYTIIMVTHIKEDMQYANQIISIRDGQVEDQVGRP